MSGEHGSREDGRRKGDSLSSPVAWKAGGGLEGTHMALEGTVAQTTHTSVSQYVLFQRSSTVSPPCILPAPENAPDLDLACALLPVCRPSP